MITPAPSSTHMHPPFDFVSAGDIDSENPKSAHEHNTTHSAFHGLPTELLSVIGEHARGLSLLALAQTCLRFRTIYASSAPQLRHQPDSQPDFTGEDLTEWRLALRRQTYQRRCCRESSEQERENGEKGRLLCSCCGSRHARTQFSDLQIGVGPETRVCKAAETGGEFALSCLGFNCFRGVFQAVETQSRSRWTSDVMSHASGVGQLTCWNTGLQTCNHLILTFAALQHMRDPGNVSNATSGALKGQHKESCAECPTAMALHFVTESRKRAFLHPDLKQEFDIRVPVHKQRNLPRRYSQPWSYKVTLQYTVLRNAPDAGLLPGALANELKAMTGAICPHIPMKELVNTGHQRTWHTLLNSDMRLQWRDSREPSLPSNYRPTMLNRCIKPGCDTKYRLALETNADGSKNIHLLVQRDVGKLEDAYDPIWLAQKVVPLGILP